MNAYIVTIGDELLIGDTINTNAAWIGSLLTQSGIRIEEVITIGDERDKIVRALEEGIARADVTILTGGLGPTHDDITRKVVAGYFGSRLVEHAPVLEHIRQIFEKRHIPFTRSNYDQAMVPDNAEVLFNKWGTAPGLLFHQKGHSIAVLPGVPHEMKALVREELLPRLKSAARKGLIYCARYFQLAGIGESTLSDKIIGDVGRLLNGRATLAYLPHIGEITLRIGCFAKNEQEGEVILSPVTEHIRQAAAEHIFSEKKDETLASVVGAMLGKKQATVAAAESCTGGLLAARITDVPGSSDYFKGAVVAYDNEVKKSELGVSSSVLEQAGAVSRETALQMAKGAAQKFGTDYALSTTGIAGPGGGTPEKPVGTIWIGFWSKKESLALRLQLTKDRIINREQTVVIALDLLRRRMNGVETLPYHLKPEFA